jgi:predicted component of type VI protein secretion system
MQNTRYSPIEESYVEEVTGMDERRIEHVRKHFRMMLQEHVTERWTVLAIGRVVRNGVGGLDFDPEFIPSNFLVSALHQFWLATRTGVVLHAYASRRN